MRTNFGIVINSKQSAFGNLESVFSHWSRAINTYCKAYKGSDAPYYYNERANLSFLTIASWCAGAIALEEYGTKKHTASGGTLKRGSSRCDLFISTGGVNFQIEAKQYWMPSHRREKRHKASIAHAFHKACDAAMANTESAARVGCVFFVPWWKTSSEYKSDPEFHIRTEIQRYLSECADVWAWCFPKQARKLKHRQSRGDNRIYPGIIIGMKAGKYFRA